MRASDVVGECARGLGDESEAPRVVARSGDRVHAVAVGEESELRRWLAGGGQAQSRRVAQRHARALQHRHPTERARRLGDDARAAHAQRLAQALVGSWLAA